MSKHAGRKKRFQSGMVQFEATEFYKIVKNQSLNYGYSPLKSAIYATLALEECMNDPATPDRLPYLSTIGIVALPEIERLQPANDEEAAEKDDMLAAYYKNNKTSLHPLLDQWRKVQKELNKPQNS